MKKLKKVAIISMIAVLLSSNTVFAASGWYTADGGSYTSANTYRKSSYDGINIVISKIAKDGKSTDCSSYKKAKVKVYAADDSKAYWSHSRGSFDTVEEKQTAYRTCKKNSTYTFLLTDKNGNPGRTTRIKTYYKGNSSSLNAEVYATETVY